MIDKFKKANIKTLIPEKVNETPDYYCTWQTQLYATSDGKPEKQREIICEKALFEETKPYGWAYFYENIRKDLFLVMDDSWDVPLNGDKSYYGSLILSEEKFPTFYDTEEDPLKKLSDKIREIGWKGLGGWMCAQESPVIFDGNNSDEYWIDRLKMCQENGMHFLKVDWGNKSRDLEFRKKIVQLAKEYAPDVIIENAMIEESISFSDVYRTYDVPAIMSIPMTIEKLIQCLKVKITDNKTKRLINCEDEVYIAAAGGFTMGVMRHPYAGNLPDGRADMSFPTCHRNLKSKMKEVERAVNWHKIAPAFGIGEEYYVSDEILTDCWEFGRAYEEFESWWFDHAGIKNNIENNVLKMTAKAAVSRGIKLPDVFADEDGNIPFVVSAKNPDGAVSVATLGRTLGRKYFIPECDVRLNCKDAEVFGVFGKYKNLTLNTTYSCKEAVVLMQDLSGGDVFDISDMIKKNDDGLTIPGNIIECIGTLEQSEEDTSEPGVVIKICKVGE